MTRFFRFKSIQLRMTVLFSFVLLTTMSVAVFLAYRFAFESARQNALDYTYELVQTVSDDVDSYISYMQDISLIISKSTDVKMFLNQQNAGTVQQMERKIRVTEQLQNITLARDDISTFAILGRDGRYALNNEDLFLNDNVNPKAEAWYRAAVEAKGQPVVSPSHVQNLIRDSYKYVVSLSRALMNEQTGEVAGVILVDLNYNRIRDLCQNISLGKRGYLFIVDDTGDIVYHPQQQLIYSDLKYEYVNEVLSSKGRHFTVEDGKDSRIYTIKPSAAAGWRIVGVTYVDELVVNNEALRLSYILTGAISVALAFLLSAYLARFISKPIKSLEASMKEIEKGNFNTKVVAYTEDEIGQLAKNFNIMTARINALIAQNEKDYEQKRHYELRALLDQINPHFLYNTLDSIVWMAEMGETDDVVEMTSSLAKLFRVALSKGSEFIPIESEIAHVASYLTIQQMRYKNKLTFDINVDDGLSRLMTPKLILQPLVENAIYHGIKNLDHAGHIFVNGSKTGDAVTFTVADDGVGMSEDDRQTVLLKSKNKDTGVGVRVTNERIRLYFGERYGIRFETTPGGGTTAIITLPALEEGWNGNDV